MIKDIQDKTKRITPKQKAQQILDDWINKMVDGYGLDWNTNIEGMTDREGDELHSQLCKLASRVCKNITKSDRYYGGK